MPLTRRKRIIRIRKVSNQRTEELHRFRKVEMVLENCREKKKDK